MDIVAVQHSSAFQKASQSKDQLESKSQNVVQPICQIQLGKKVEISFFSNTPQEFLQNTMKELMNHVG